MATAAILPMSAQETIKTLYEGEAKEISWDNTLTIPAEQFADDVNVGYYINISLSDPTGAIEIKANGMWLPGSRYTRPEATATEYKAYITADMLEALKQYGLEICGDKFTLTGVSICNDGFVMPAGAIWGGFCWIDGWKTLEIFKTAFDKYDGQRYMDIYLSDDLDGYDGYFLKVLTTWTPETLWADNSQITHTPKVATVDLKGINVKESLADVTTLIIQGYQEAGNPFNITAVALRSENVSTGINVIAPSEDSETTTVYNLQGMIVKAGVSVEDAKASLPKGIYVANGKKFIVR